MEDVGIKLAYFPSERLKLSIGYSLMYWSSVVRPGNQIDLSVDSRLFTNSVVDQPPPIPRLPQSTDFLVPGIEFRSRAPLLNHVSRKRDRTLLPNGPQDASHRRVLSLFAKGHLIPDQGRDHDGDHDGSDQQLAERPQQAAPEGSLADAQAVLGVASFPGLTDHRPD